jgi:hypothetical protein
MLCGAHFTIKGKRQNQNHKTQKTKNWYGAGLKPALYDE